MENFGHSDFSFVKYTFEHGSVWTSFWRWISKEGGKEKKETEAATALKASWRENEQPRESSSSLDTLRAAQWWFFHFLYFLSLSPLFFSHFPDTFQASLAFSKAFQVFILPPPLFTFFLLPFLLHPLPLPSNDFFPPRDTTTRKLHWDSELQRMQFVIGGRGGGGGEKVEIWNSRK